jgi:hypothetical protein
VMTWFTQASAGVAGAGAGAAGAGAGAGAGAWVGLAPSPGEGGVLAGGLDSARLTSVMPRLRSTPVRSLSPVQPIGSVAAQAALAFGGVVRAWPNRSISRRSWKDTGRGSYELIRYRSRWG